MKVSVLCLSLNKFHSFAKTVPDNLRRTGLEESEFEILICDQGSTDQDLLDLQASLRPSYYRKNLFNEGISRALNQLILRARGHHVFFMPDDFILPDNWLKHLVDYADAIPGAGIVGFEGQDLILPLKWVTARDGSSKLIAIQEDPTVYEGSQIFGATLMTRELIHRIGFYCEDYHPYGLEDSDLCFRSRLSGLRNFYIPGFRSVHIGLEDNTNQAEKKAAYFSNLGLHRWRASNYYRIGTYCPPPIAKDPLV